MEPFLAIKAYSLPSHVRVMKKQPYLKESNRNTTHLTHFFSGSEPRLTDAIQRYLSQNGEVRRSQ